MTRNTDMPRRILEAARRIVGEGGTGALTFEAVARRLGVTKQAVIYWFPTKQDLGRELAVPAIEAEAEAVAAAVAGAGDAREAIAQAVRAAVAFHTADLERFRQVYLAIQIDPNPQRLMPPATLDAHVHPATDRLYDALEAALSQSAGLRPGLLPRRAAVCVHMAALGLVLMVALGAALDDPLAHRTEDLVDSVIAILTDGAAA